VDKDGEPWFCAKDVCCALGIGNASEALRKIDDEDKSHIILNDTNRNHLILNESGLYAVILMSRKPEARRFKKWVTSEVLPTIRKTGKYEAPAAVPALASNIAEQVLMIQSQTAQVSRTR
jgi:anti-repressor protein